MSHDQRGTLIILLVLGLLYFILFIPPNLTGARDADMLSVFEVDEYAQYPHVVRMLTPGDTPYQSLRNFTVYQHYYYGYPFYFFSALSVLPIRLIYGAGWTSQTPLIVMMLRQMMNILPMLIAALLLIHMQTRFKPRWKAVSLFILMLTLPGVVSNNFFWHPDGLSLLFVALTLYLLDLDSLAFKKHFFLAAAACGVAVGIKQQGVFFFAAIPLYILWGTMTRKLVCGRGMLMGMAFVVVMVASVIITNPLLLLPMERSEIIQLKWQDLQMLNLGHFMRTTEPYFQWGSYPEDFRLHYAEVFFLLLMLVALAKAILRSEKRLTNAVLLAYILPLAVTLNFAGTRRTHYFIPVVIPLVSTLGHLFPERLSAILTGGTRWRRSPRAWLSWLIPLLSCALILLQFVLFIRTDISHYRATLHREQESVSLDFARKIETLYLSRIEPSQRVVIYRDWHIYVQPAPNRQVEMSWNLATYDLLDDLAPDLILLEQARIRLFTDPGAVEQASDPGAMAAWQEFYGDADANQVPGYRQFYRDAFGVALVRESLFKTNSLAPP